MEEKHLTISFDKEQLIYLASAIIVAGISSNYKTSAPSSSSHAIVAKGVAKDLLDSILK